MSSVAVEPSASSTSYKELVFELLRKTSTHLENLQQTNAQTSHIVQQLTALQQHGANMDRFILRRLEDFRDMSQSLNEKISILTNFNSLRYGDYAATLREPIPANTSNFPKLFDAPSTPENMALRSAESDRLIEKAGISAREAHTLTLRYFDRDPATGPPDYSEGSYVLRNYYGCVPPYGDPRTDAPARKDAPSDAHAEETPAASDAEGVAPASTKATLATVEPEKATPAASAMDVDADTTAATPSPALSEKAAGNKRSRDEDEEPLASEEQQPTKRARVENEEPAPAEGSTRPRVIIPRTRWTEEIEFYESDYARRYSSTCFLHKEPPMQKERREYGKKITMMVLEAKRRTGQL